MMLPIIGTVRNTVKLAEMDSKWQQKKKSKAWKEEMDPQVRQIMQYKEDLQKMRESKQMASIDAKLNSGGILTPEEITYLQKNSPEKYREYVDLKNEREAYKRQMESCRTKEEVEKLKMAKMNGFLAEAKSVKNNPNIPKGKKKELMEKILRRTMGIQDEYMDFVRSGRYGKLPTEEELAEETKERAGQGKESAENLDESVAESTEKEENETGMPEEGNETEDMDSTDRKETENRNEGAKISQETERHEANTLPDLKQAADAVFQEIELELKGRLKAYMP